MADEEAKPPKAETSILKKINWKNLVYGRFGRYSDIFTQVFRALFGRDRISRWIAVWFLVSVAGVIYLGQIVVSNLSGVFKQQGNKPVEGVARVAEFIAKQAEEAKRRNTTLNLGDFIVELKFAPGEVRPRGVMNMAELQIVIECDVKETCVYIDTNLVQVRNELTNVFVAIDREEVMSLEGKKRLKKILMERLNMWLPKGRVQSLFFAKFVVA